MTTQPRCPPAASAVLLLISLVNAQALTYVRAWAGKYSGHGVVVIDVHIPEFSFEHNADNVRRAVQDLRINYPVATDKLPAARRRRGQLPGAVVQGPGNGGYPPEDAKAAPMFLPDILRYDG